MKERVIDNSWSFVGADTKEFSHRYHVYPAMMIPQIARRLIAEYKPKNTKFIFDPYCGTGTTMVEAKLANINSAGTDLNPMARLISKSKITNYDLDKILQYKDLLSDLSFAFSFNPIDKNQKIINFENINFWFPKKSIRELSFLLNNIHENIDIDYQDFFIVALSETLREVSYTRNSEFKLYRMPKHKMEQHNPDTFGIFLNKVNRNIEGLEALNETGTNTNVKVYDFNTCFVEPKKVLNQEIDFIVTSPPYGDSRTTVAYGQFSRLSNQWLGIENASQIDNILMGGSRKDDLTTFYTEYAKEELMQIKEIDNKRFIEVENFLNDYKLSIDNVARSIRKNGRVAYVVGNRTVKGVQIPLDYITVELFEQNGFEHITTIVREIPNKRMPKENSPTNEKGKKSSTMNNEYIVIMEKH
ncbi:MAG: site-specific DNA-methyltransferase [Bacteroidales bacterium]|nr:site-specific DNA-methyltransferase [Bacteroidales bacterium]NLK81328.1 site-specific DNA-methyltransferase [Bacteroidales bacterium]